MPPRKKRGKTTTKSSTPPPAINFEAIQARVASFKLEVCEYDGYVLDGNEKNYVDLKGYGVVIHNETLDDKRFCCLSSAKCMEEKLTVKLGEAKGPGNKKKWISSNATRHLREEHNIITKKALDMENKSIEEGQERHEIKHAFRNNVDRLCLLQWVKMIILMRLPFMFVTYQVVRDTWHYTCVGEMPKNISRPRVLHICTEIYSQTLGVIKHLMLGAIAANGKQVFSLNLDNWKPKNAVRRFTGLRIYFMDNCFKLRTFLLGMREFKPSFGMRHGVGGLRKSMKVWAQGILNTYDLNFDNIFSATTDGAADVRILAQQDMNAIWGWCPPHMLNRVLHYAFGKRNPEMKREIDEMKKVITLIRDSTQYGTMWQENLDKENPDMAKKVLKSHQDQRFMGVYLTVLRFYEMYESIMLTCQNAPTITNYVTMTKSELGQLLSILKPLRELSIKSQVQSE